MQILKSILLAAMLSSLSAPVLAQDWVADRLRGSVLQLKSSSWVPLGRGEIVPNGRKIRTLENGQVELVRGQERIALAANTEVAVRDAAGQKMTSVIQTAGAVTVYAERRNVRHFSVQTPVLAAVVKGTQFTVTYRDGQARVDVDEGVVQVQDNEHEMVADITRGQSAAASQSSPLDVSGPGADRVVYLIEGAVVPAVAREAVLSGALEPEAALEAVQSRTIPNANNSRGHSPELKSVEGRGQNGAPRTDNTPPAHSNAGGNNSGNSGHDRPPAHSNAGGNGNSSSGNASNNGNGDGPPVHSNAGGNNSSSDSDDDEEDEASTERGPPEHSNAGGNGNGRGHQ